MPRQATQSHAQVQLLRRLVREYIDCVTGFKPGDCEVIRRSVRSVAASVGGELGRDALRIIEVEGYEP
jgi:hypothetical protein